MATNDKAAVPAVPAGRRRLTYAGAAALALLIGACAKSPNIAEFKASGDAKTRAEAPLAASPDTLLRLADSARAMGNLDGAAGLYSRAAMAAPDDPELQVRLGFTLHKLGAQLEAEAAFRRAIAADLGNADALRGLGITLIARDMPHHAIEYLEEAIAARPDSRAYNAMGVALDMVGERVSAREAYGAGLAGDPENLSLLNNFGLSLTLSRHYAEAIAVLGRAVDNPKATPRHRQNLALAYGLAGRLDKAAEVANTDLDMRAVRGNLRYYTWLRGQPSGLTEQALGPNLEIAPPIQLADAALAPEFAPKPPLARGVTEAAAPIFDGALLDRGPIVLTPGSQTGSLYRDSGAIPPALRKPAARDPMPQDPEDHPQDPQDNVIWDLQSIETDDPAAGDADGKDADTSGGKKPELRGDSPSAGQNDQTVDRDGGKPAKSVVELPENPEFAAIVSNSASQHADSAPAPPATAPSEVSPITLSPTTELADESRAATDIAPPATQIAALSPEDADQDADPYADPYASIDDSAISTVAVGDFSSDHMAVEYPASRDDVATMDSAASIEPNFAALAAQAENATPRQAATPSTPNAGVGQAHAAAPVPDTPVADTETDRLGTAEIPASGPNPARLADNMGEDAASTGVAPLPWAEYPAGPAIAPRAAPPPMARRDEDIDSAPKAHRHATIVAGRPPPSEPVVDPAPRAESPLKVAETPVNVAVAPERSATVAMPPPDSSEYAGLAAEPEEIEPPELLLALASSSGDSAPSTGTAVRKTTDTVATDPQLVDPQPVAAPQAGARADEQPPPPPRQAGRQAGSTRLLRSGMTLGLWPPRSAPRGSQEGPRILASAAVAVGGISRTLVGSLTPAGPDAATPSTAMATFGAVPNPGVSAPVYGLAALISVGFLSLLWMRRRKPGDANGGPLVDTGSETKL